MRKNKTESLTDQLRRLIDDCGVTRYNIARQTGISQSTLCKFHLGQRGLSMEALNTLAEYLQLELVSRKAK